MKLLGVETSSLVFSVAVCDGDRILSSLKSSDATRRSELLTGLIEEALRGAGLTLAALDGLAVSIGPGSFTGLRVGVTTVKTLAWALKKKVLPVSTLEVIAHNFNCSPDLELRNGAASSSRSHAPIGVFLDARRGKVYAALFSPDAEELLKRLSPDRLLPPGEALNQFPEGTVLVGDGLIRYRDLVNSLDGKEWSLTPESDWIPSADALCRIAAHRWPNGVLDDPHPLVPEYLYSKESEIVGW